MTDNANTFLIYQINGIGWLDMIKKKKLPEKIILNYIAEDSDLFLYEGNNDRAEIRR